MSIADNIRRIHERMGAAAERAGRNAEGVSLVAVVKNRCLDEIREVAATGQRLMAFNKVQEGQTTIPELPESLIWHMIGHLQTNKARYVPALFAAVHSVDSLRVAEALDRAMGREEFAHKEPLDILMEVNVSGEQTKQGLSPADVPAMAEAIGRLHRLRLSGLMTMAPYVEDPEETRPVFRQLRALRDRLIDRTLLPAEGAHLSMGMTNDFEVAIEEGATLIRVGTALFEGLDR